MILNTEYEYYESTRSYGAGLGQRMERLRLL